MSALITHSRAPFRIASTLVAMLGTVAALNIATVIPAQADASGPVVGGYLDWGVKASFRAYILGPVAHGSITPAVGATENGDGTYRFPATGGNHDHSGGNTDASLAGSLRFLGHGGALDVTISELRIEIRGNAGLMRLDVVAGNPRGGAPTTYDDIEFVTFDLSAVTPTSTATGWSWSGVPAVLTEAGSAALGGFYQPGTPMDPLAFTLEIGGLEPITTTTSLPSSSVPTTSAPSSAPTGVNPVIATPAFAG
ncbi:MAG: HtaA domain-containing protein [Acidimicrobiales bacterium]|nr:HtaA domain-containing protein [Acidimicrobiales bacterium]